MTLIHVMDTETARTDCPSICEIALVTIDTSKKSIVSWESSLVDPLVEMDEICRATHHIDPELVKEKMTAKDWLYEYMPDTGPIFAHNASFDKGHFDGMLDDRQWYCTLKLSRKLYPNAPKHSNQVLRYYLNLDVSDMPTDPSSCVTNEFSSYDKDILNMHRALYDTWCTAKMVLKMIDEYGYDNLIQMHDTPTLLRTFRFGNKHQNKTWDQVAVEDPKYLQWMHNKVTDLDDDTRHTLNHYLKR